MFFLYIYKDLFDAILDGRLAMERPSENALDKASHSNAPVRKRLRLRRKQSTSSSSLELSPSVAGCEPPPTDQGTEQMNGPANEELDSSVEGKEPTSETPSTEGGQLVIEVPDSLPQYDVPGLADASFTCQGSDMEQVAPICIEDDEATEPSTVVEIPDTPLRPGVAKVNVWVPVEQADKVDGADTRGSETLSVLEFPASLYRPQYNSGHCFARVYVRLEDRPCPPAGAAEGTDAAKTRSPASCLHIGLGLYRVCDMYLGVVWGNLHPI